MTLEEEIIEISNKYINYLECCGESSAWDNAPVILQDDIPYFTREIIELFKNELED